MNINRWMVYSSLIFNDRLKRYAEYINNARNHGYEIISLEKFFLADRRDGKHFILRHDVDDKELAVRKMFEKEKSLGITSTYYFRDSTVDTDLIDEMIENGFEVGYHFETIAYYAQKNGISDKNEIDKSVLPDLLKGEIHSFEDRIGHKINSICSHGADENRRLNISSNSITEENDINQFGVMFEAYNKELYEDIDCHIMDGTVTRFLGFSYYENPLSAVAADYQNILFLSHPHHWYDTPRMRKAKVRDILQGKAVFERSQRKFIRVQL